MSYKVLLVSCLLVSTALKAQWGQTSPSVTSSDFISISFMGRYGCLTTPETIFHSADRGQTWKDVRHSGQYESFCATTPAGNNLIAAISYSSEGFDRAMLHLSANDGGSWASLATGLPYRMKKVVSSGDTVWILGQYMYPPPYDDIVMKTTDGGKTWSRHDCTFDDICFRNGKVGWAIAGLTIYKTTDGGGSWETKFSTTSGPPLYGIRFVDDSVGWAYGSGGALLKSSDAGEHWAEVNTTIIRNNLCSFFLDRNTGWLAGYTSVVKTSDAGNSWVDETLPINYLYWATCVYFRNPSDGFLATSDNDLFNTTDGGATWVQLQGVQARDLCFVDSLVGYAVAGSDRISKTTDGGKSWVLQLTQNHESSDLLGVTFLSPDNGWAVGNYGTMYHTTNGGFDWRIQQSLRLPAFTSAAATDPQHIWVAGTNGLIVKLSDGGAPFEHQFTRTLAKLTDLQFVDSIHGWAISSPGDMILKTSNGGRDWERVRYSYRGPHVSMHFVDPQTGWLLDTYSTTVLHAWYYYSDIHKTTDGGATWQRIAGVDGTYNKVFFLNSSEGLIAGDHGSIRRSADGGVTWIAEQSGTTAGLKDIGLGDHIYIVGTGGVMLQSDAIYSTPGGDATIDRFALFQNYPNPFNPTTVVSYQLPVASEVRLAVYDVLGREVLVLMNEKREAGRYEVKFDGTGLSSGVYFCRMQAGEFVQTRELLLVR